MGLLHELRAHRHQLLVTGGQQTLHGVKRIRFRTDQHAAGVLFHAVEDGVGGIVRGHVQELLEVLHLQIEKADLPNKV